MARTERVRVTRPWFDNDEVFDAAKIRITPGYALIPNHVCWNPPIRHKRTSYWDRHLTPST